MATAEGQIQRLPEVLASQIAAGEVVERPASVVKELVENAIDAEASQIVVDVDDGGLSMLRVTDDGVGMNRADALLCVERHATSKIRTVEDLHAVATLGFRGEALAAICSVSRFALETRQRGALSGVSVRLDGGGPAAVADAGVPVGTRIEVRDLFFNVPARRKFLRSPAAEMKRIAEVFTEFALGYPHLHLRLSHGGRVVADYPGERDLKPRLGAVFGRPVAARLHRVWLDGHLRIDGYLSEPGLDRPTGRSLHVFVNGRPVRDRVLLHALVAGYGSLIDRGRQPLGALYLLVDPATVDVNVHPTKAEVRFAESERVYAAVRHAVQTMLQQAPWLSPLPAGAAEPAPDYGAPPHVSPAAPAFAGRRAAGAPTPLLPLTAPANAPRLLLRFASGTAADPSLDAGALSAAPAAADGAPPRALRFSSLRYVGQAHHTYLLCEDGEALYVIDQHAAHERVNFERLLRAHDEGGVARQALLVPLDLEVALADAEAIEAEAANLLAFGFEIERFGTQNVVVRAVPLLLGGHPVGPLVSGLVADLARPGRPGDTRARVERTLATVACHASVRAGDPLDPREAQALLTALDGLDLATHCPHGRPAVVRFPFGEVAAWFART